MLSGFYTAASGMLMNQRGLNVTAENMANQHTPGYHAKTLTGTDFEKELVRQQSSQKTAIGGGAPIALVSREAIDFTGGEFTGTGRVYDMAVGGEGFFTVQSGGGEVLTRNGNFDMDEQGYLILRGVGRVLGDNGPIQVNNSSFSVGVTGNVYDGNSNVIDRLRIQTPDNYDNLQLNENGTYSMQGGQLTRSYPEIQQAVLEESNVDLNQEVTNSMALQRAFQSCGKAITIVDQMNQKTAAQIGSL